MIWHLSSSNKKSSRIPFSADSFLRVTCVPDYPGFDKSLGEHYHFRKQGFLVGVFLHLLCPQREWEGTFLFLKHVHDRRLPTSRTFVAEPCLLHRPVPKCLRQGNSLYHHMYLWNLTFLLWARISWKVYFPLTCPSELNLGWLPHDSPRAFVMVPFFRKEENP